MAKLSASRRKALPKSGKANSKLGKKQPQKDGLGKYADQLAKRLK